MLVALAPLLAFAEAARSAVSLRILLTGIQTGSLSLVTDAVLFGIVCLYLAGARQLTRRGRQWSGWSTAAFVVGLAAIWVAVCSGLAAYDDVNVTMHVIQHVLLMMIAPPLIALGRPVTLATQASRRTVQVRILRIVHSPVVAALTFPVFVWVLYYGTMYVFFMTGVYQYAIVHPLFHDATHLWFFVAGYLFWEPLIGLDPARWRWPYPVRAVSLFLGMPFESFLGIGIAQMARPISSINSLANTHTAGDTLWVLAMAVTGLWLAVILWQWYRQMERETVRQDRKLEVEQVENRARAEALGLDLPPDVTVPWWRIAELERRRDRAEEPSARADAGGGWRTTR
ncbi:MAG: cytochrome c oxidase assembly protein [Acidimicrobiales bacterium]